MPDSMRYVVNSELPSDIFNMSHIVSLVQVPGIGENLADKIANWQQKYRPVIKN